MKHFYLIILCLVCYVSNAQFEGIQLVLVDANVGSAIFQGCSECSNESNHEGLNAIFLNHNVNWYQNSFVYSDEEMNGRIYMVNCDNCDLDQFLQDLNNYNTVVHLASLGNEFGYFNHGISLKLINDNIGIPTGESNGIVTTNNPALNQIFIDYNVNIYQFVNEGFENWEQYELFCECDAVQLRQEIDALDTVVLSTDYLYMGFLLSTNENALNETKIHPNPFKDKLTIATNAQISELVVYDVLGKAIFKSNSISVFEEFSSSLSSGVYTLKIYDSDNRNITKKLIKQ